MDMSLRWGKDILVKGHNLLLEIHDLCLVIIRMCGILCVWSIYKFARASCW